MDSPLKKAFLVAIALAPIMLLISCENEHLNTDNSTSIIDEDFKTIIYNGQAIDVTKIDNFYLWGDILIPETAVIVTDNTSEGSSTLQNTSSQSQSIVADSETLWPNNTVPYFFDPNFTNTRTAEAAIHHWELFTTINFVESLEQADSDLIIFEGSGCSATVGYRDGRHENSVSIGNSCDVGDAIHEFGHVVGLYHEQNRNDRDEYVQVFLENIIPAFHSQFMKNEDKGFDSLEFTPFDFDSTMLYSSDIFSVEGLNNSMLKLNGTSFPRSEVLSKYDIIGIESVYRDGSPKKVAISSLITGGNYISSENGTKEITSTRENIGSWETFTVLPIGKGLLSFQASNGKMLSVDQDGALKFNANTVGNNEIFLAEYNTTINGKFYYTISHEDFSTMFVDDSTNEIKIDNSGGGGQDSLFAIEILE